MVRFFRGELAPGEVSDVDQHIDGCPECRVLFSSLASSEALAPELAATELASGLRHAPASGETYPDREPAPSLIPGTVLADRFVVETLIGSGGMAHVFRGLDRLTGAQVAIKAIQGNTSEEIQRFEREARVLMSLEHPGIVRYIQHDRGSNGAPYLVMEWLDGEDLSARLKRGRLSIDETRVLGLRVASALGATHALGIVHRDIKPSNIFLKEGRLERATVLDYGVARHGLPQPASQATRTGTLLGTLGYMAPEQARGAKTADQRADVFSLGCVLYECLVGERLFTGAHAVEVLANLLTLTVEPPRKTRPEIPPALDALVTRMLSRDVTARPDGGYAVAGELERMAHPWPAPLPPTAWKGGRRWLVPALISTGVVVVAALATEHWVGQDGRARPSAVSSASPVSPMAHTESDVAPRTPALPPPALPPPALPPPHGPPPAVASAAQEPANVPGQAAPAAAAASSSAPRPAAARPPTSPTKRTPRTEPDPFGNYRN